MMISLSDIALARYRLAHFLAPTPVEPAPALGERVWFKLENTQQTHSFKIRGALNAMLALSPEARSRGVVTASSGNHAQGIASAARTLGLSAQIVMSTHTAQRKIAGVRRWGIEPVLYGDSYTDAEREALRLRDEGGLTFVSPYNDPQVIAGQGTIGLEIYDKLPEVERVIVPVGGGGLISGVAVALKQLLPSVEIIGVNPVDAPTLYNAFYRAQLPDLERSLADALPGAIEAGSITLDLAAHYVDQMILVTEAQIAEAMRWLLTDQGWLIEGGGAVGAAAVLSGAIPRDRKHTVIILSGGNVDAEIISQIICGGHA